MKKKQFKKNDDWYMTFYCIYEKENVKTIRFIGQIDRGDTGKDYLGWLAIYYPDDCEMPLEDLIEWDIYYQKNKLIESCIDVIENELEPQECFEQANTWLKADGNGSEFKKILDLEIDTPCGYYYGY